MLKFRPGCTTFIRQVSNTNVCLTRNKCIQHVEITIQTRQIALTYVGSLVFCPCKGGAVLMFCEVPAFAGLVCVVSLTFLSYRRNSHFLLVMQSHSCGFTESLTVSDETDLRDEKKWSTAVENKITPGTHWASQPDDILLQEYLTVDFSIFENKKDLLTSA